MAKVSISTAKFYEIRQSYVYDQKHQKIQNDQNFKFVFSNRFEWH